MLRTVVAALALLLLVACGRSGPAVGTWVYDWKASMTPQELGFLDTLTAEQRAEAEKQLSVEMELRKDGTGHGSVTAGARAAVQGDFKWSERNGVVTIEGASKDRGELHLRDGKLYVKIPGRDAEGVFVRK